MRGIVCFASVGIHSSKFVWIHFKREDLDTIHLRDTSCAFESVALADRVTSFDRVVRSPLCFSSFAVGWHGDPMFPRELSCSFAGFVDVATLHRF